MIIARGEGAREERARSRGSPPSPVTCAPRRLPRATNMEESCVVFPRKLLKKMISMYREHPCLWNKNCVSYKLKQKRYEAISKLTQLVQEHEPSATRVHVLRKIESLRACVRREHKRVRDSRIRVAAGGTDGIYKPMLWYYDLFSFVFTDDETDDEIYQKAQTVHENEVKTFVLLL